MTECECYLCKSKNHTSQEHYCIVEAIKQERERIVGIIKKRIRYNEAEPINKDHILIYKGLLKEINPRSED